MNYEKIKEIQTAKESKRKLSLVKPIDDEKRKTSVKVYKILIKQ